MLTFVTTAWLEKECRAEGIFHYVGMYTFRHCFPSEHHLLQADECRSNDHHEKSDLVNHSYAKMLYPDHHVISIDCLGNAGGWDIASIRPTWYCPFRLLSLNSNNATLSPPLYTVPRATQRPHALPRQKIDITWWSGYSILASAIIVVNVTFDPPTWAQPGRTVPGPHTFDGAGSNPTDLRLDRSIPGFLCRFAITCVCPRIPSMTLP